MHDVLVVLAFYVIARVSVGNTFIACMLTIVGYSINATIVIFDNLTTFIMVVALFVLGVSSIKEFASPLMVGIACGAYTSVCITGALWYVMRKRTDGLTEKKKH